MPQADRMNRGAWLKTEMMVECWRQIQPLTVFGGGVFIQDETTVVPEWGLYDRTDWFVDSHYVKNPAYFWKIIVSKETSKDKSTAIAFWMPNHESAKASNTQDYVVSLNQLEKLLLKWGAAETFSIEGVDKDKVMTVWDDPSGCSRQ